MKHEDTSGQRVRVVALSVGQEHFAQGNPGPEANFARLLEFAEASIPQQPDIICFPEFAITGCPYLSPEEVRAEGEPVPGDGPYYRQYAALARNSKAVVCGWMVEKETDEIYHNTSFLVAPDGAFIGQYRKVHPTPGEEGRWGFVPGDDIPVFDLGFVKLGIAICWDMSFPEVCRSIMLRGADLILHPTVGNDRRDMCPVRCKENGLPMVISVFTDSSYALDAANSLPSRTSSMPSSCSRTRGLSCSRSPSTRLQTVRIPRFWFNHDANRTNSMRLCTSPANSRIWGRQLRGFLGRALRLIRA